MAEIPPGKAILAKLINGKSQSMSKQSKVIGDTLLRLAEPGLKPKTMFAKVRQEHPEASRKEIILAAFHTIISCADTDLAKARQIQNFALAVRMEREH